MEELNQAIEIVAYHESGHILLAYLQGHAVLKAEIQVEDGQFKHAETVYTTDVSDIVKEYEFTLLFGNPRNLSDQQTQMVLSHWHNVLSKSLGGPIAELYLENKANLYWEPKIKLIGGDGDNIKHFNSFLIKHDPNYDENSLEQRIKDIAESIKLHWDIIENLSKILCESENHFIDQSTIESILNEYGFPRE